MNPIHSIEIRTATHQESTRQRGSCCSRFVYFPWNVAKKLYNTFRFIYTYNVKETFEKVLSNNPFIAVHETYAKNWHLTANTTLFKALLCFPRNDPNGFFTIGVNHKTILKVMQKVFPNEKITHNDCILTCEAAYVNKYRKILLHGLSIKTLDANSKLINDWAFTCIQNCLDSSNKNGSLNISEVAKKYTLVNICQQLLGAEFLNNNIIQAVDFFNFVVIRNSFKLPLTWNERIKFQKMIQILQDTIKEVLLAKNSSIIDSMTQENFTETQMKVMVLVTFLAGYETTASLLTFIVWQLALDESLQEEIRNEVNSHFNLNSLNTLANNLKSLDFLVKESLRKFTPIYSFPRDAAKDLKIIARNKFGQEVTSAFIPKGDSLNPCISVAAKNSPAMAFLEDAHKQLSGMPFGYGVHRCPGDLFAFKQIKTFILFLVMQAKISTKMKEEIKQIGFFTNKLAEDVYITLNPLKK